MLLPVAGVAVGATQIVRGVANTPNAIQQERKGMHWDQHTREWIEQPGLAILIDDEVSLALCFASRMVTPTAPSAFPEPPQTTSVRMVARMVAIKSVSPQKQVTQAARMKWNGAQRAGSRLSQEDDYYALLEVPRDATPEHIKKQVSSPHGTHRSRQPT